MLMQRIRPHTGFTIVELLIVIVVIAILATITIVSYTGIADRAEETRVLSEANSWEKLMVTYGVFNGTSFHEGYNALHPSTPIQANECLGESLPARDGFAAGSCAYNVSTNAQTSAVNTQAMAHLSQTAGISLPKGNTPYANVSYGVPAGETWRIRGILYSPTAEGGMLHYYLQGDRSCGSYTKFYAPQDNSTRCSKVL